MCIGTKIHVSMETCEVPERMRLQPPVLLLGLRGSGCYCTMEGWQIAESSLHRHVLACFLLLDVIMGKYRDLSHQWEKKNMFVYTFLHPRIYCIQLSFNQKTFDRPAAAGLLPHLWPHQNVSEVSCVNRCVCFLNNERKYHKCYTVSSWRFKCNPSQWFLCISFEANCTEIPDGGVVRSITCNWSSY